MSIINDSGWSRLFFWFFWLCGLSLVLYFLVRFFVTGFILGQLKSASLSFIGFSMQGLVQTTALKRYQTAESIWAPFLVLGVGSLSLLLLIALIYIV